MSTLSNNFQEVEDFQLNPGDYIDQLRSLDLSALREIFLKPSRVSRIESLLRSIDTIVPVGNHKFNFFTDNPQEKLIKQNYRWLFLDKNQENVASRIYTIIIREISDYLYQETKGGVSLGCYGSTINGTSTFPISRFFPYPKDYTEETFAISNWHSDLDIFLIRHKGNLSELWWIIMIVDERVSLIQENIPRSILFDRPEDIYYLNRGTLKEKGLRFIEM